MSLIAHYPLNGDARDYFGNATTVNGSSGISYIDGKIGRAISFDNSSTGYLSAPEISTYLHGKPEASIALWVKKSAVQYGFLQLSGYSSSNGNLYPYQTTTKVYLDVFRTNRLGPIYMPTSVLEWHHLVITQKPGQWKLYQNGVLVNTSGADATVSTDYLQFELGRNSGSRYAYGDFDDVRIYDHALSEKEVINLYRANYLTSSLRTSSGINLPNVTVAESAPLTYDNGFIGDGSGRIVHTGHDAVFTELTISLYFRLDLAAKNYVLDTNTSRDMIFKVDNDSTNTIQAGINGNYPKVNIGELIGREVHFVMTYDGAVQKIFADGIKVSESSTSGAVSLGELYIGGYYQYETYDFNGKIRDLQFFAREFSEAEVSSFSANAMSVDNIGNMHSKHLDESPKVRYIRDYLNGSTYNSGEHWVEIQANDTDGVNVALNADAYDEVGNPEPELTDGNTNTNSYVSGNTYMEVDLGSVFLLDNVHIWHYYGDGRTYYGTKTEVSVDGQNWITIFDNEVDGLYPETPSGKVHRVRSPSKFSVNYSGVSVGEASEVGISRGLVSWLPLIGDTKDRVTNDVATNNGATPVGDGYQFDGVDDYIDLPNDLGYDTQVSAFASFIALGTPAGNYHIIFGDSNLELTINTGDFLRSGIETSTGREVSNHGSGLLDGNWHYVGFTFDGSEKIAYIDGVAVGTLATTGVLISSFTNRRIGRFGTNTTYYMNGIIANSKIYKIALTPEEIAQEYNSGKASLNKNSAFAKEFIEV